MFSLYNGKRFLSFKSRKVRVFLEVQAFEVVKYTLYLNFSKKIWVLHLSACPITSGLCISPALAWFLLFPVKSSSHFLVFTKGQAPAFICALQVAFLSTSHLQRWKLEMETAPAQHPFPAVQEQCRGQSAALPEFHGTGMKEVQPQRAFTSLISRQSCSGTGNNWHCSFLQGRMLRAGVQLDSPCWAVESLTFPSSTPCFCLLVLLKQLMAAGIPNSS